ncbi:MAG: LysE family translocator [Bdellovibrionales bacterium]|nr:LysE family translocator [Bdellovibrionales bacterium]
MIVPLFAGTVLGFIGAMPIAGPISALVLRYGLKRQFKKGRALGFGAGLAEAMYVLLAFLGFELFFKSIPYFESSMSAMAGIILIMLGIHFCRAKPARWAESEPTPKEKGRGAFLLGFGVSIVNPTLLATWTAVIASLHRVAAFPYTPESGGSFAFGVWIGTGLWFVLMLDLIKRNHSRFKNHWLKGIMTGMGVLLILLGIWALRRLVE